MKNLNVHIYTTPHCNLKCRHCYSADNKGSGLLWGMNDFLKAIYYIFGKYNPHFDIEGGELFLCDYIPEMLEKLELPILNRFTITTNGTLYKKINRLTANNLNEFRISVEGHTDKLQNELRNIPLTNVIRNIEKWRDDGLDICLRITLNKRNIELLEEMIDYFVAMGIYRFSFYELQFVGSAKKLEETYKLDQNDIVNIIQTLERVITKNHKFEMIKLSLNQSKKNIYEDYKQSQEFSHVLENNIIQKSSLTINYNGALGICPWTIENSDHNKYDDIIFQKSVDNIIENQKEPHTCINCTMYQFYYKCQEQLVWN